MTKKINKSIKPKIKTVKKAVKNLSTKRKKVKIKSIKKPLKPSKTFFSKIRNIFRSTKI